MKELNYEHLYGCAEINNEILNLTQHEATKEQLDAGVINLTPAKAAEARRLLTFHDLPSERLVRDRGEKLAILAKKEFESGDVMIAGAPFLMPYLAVSLMWRNLNPVYAYSKRQSIEKILPDGTVQKSSFFKHSGFVRFICS